MSTTTTTRTTIDIAKHDFAETQRAIAAVADPDQIDVNFDQICYADIKVKDEHGNSIALFIHRDTIPSLIARLTKVHAEAEAHVAARNAARNEVQS